MTQMFNVAMPESTSWTVLPGRGDRSNIEVTVIEA